MTELASLVHYVCGPTGLCSQADDVGGFVIDADLLYHYGLYRAAVLGFEDSEEDQKLQLDQLSFLCRLAIDRRIGAVTEDKQVYTLHAQLGFALFEFIGEPSLAPLFLMSSRFITMLYLSCLFGAHSDEQRRLHFGPPKVANKLWSSLRKLESQMFTLMALSQIQINCPAELLAVMGAICAVEFPDDPDIQVGRLVTPFPPPLTRMKNTEAYRQVCETTRAILEIMRSSSPA